MLCQVVSVCHPSVYLPIVILNNMHRIIVSDVEMSFLKDSWQSVTTIIKWYGDHQDEMIPVAGPGNWNDPDMVTRRLNIWSMGPL